MVLIKEFPKKVILWCEVPSPEGVETPIVPSFRVTERMIKEFVYTFTALSNNKGSMRGRGWQDAFATADPAKAKKRAKALGMDIEWLSDGRIKAILRPRCQMRVFEGRKGRRMWFNMMAGMHGEELRSATMADGTEILDQLKFIQKNHLNPSLLCNTSTTP